MAKDCYIHIRVSSSDKDLISFCAQKHGMSITDYIMYCVLRDCNVASSRDPAVIQFLSRLKTDVIK